MDTIKSNKEISEIFQTGKRYSNPYATFIVRIPVALSSCNETDSQDEKSAAEAAFRRTGRVAFIAGKKLGNAVWRNSAKRRLREVYRANLDKFNGLDVLFIARSPILRDSYSKVLTTCEKTMKRFSNE